LTHSPAPQSWLFQPSGPVPPRLLNAELTANHYLGPAVRGWGWADEFGCMVIARPTSRQLPRHWLEVTRWCLSGERNGGSRQWARVRRWLRHAFPECTTVVSYSDPSAGHTGALYRACNWWWAPTWHRIVPPPTGNGAWGAGAGQSVKDRWIFPLRHDRERVSILRLEGSYIARFPWAEYCEPGGADWRAFERHERSS